MCKRFGDRQFRCITCSSGCDAAMTAHLPGQDTEYACNDDQSMCDMHANTKDDMKSAQHVTPSVVEVMDSWNDCRSETMLAAAKFGQEEKIVARASEAVDEQSAGALASADALVLADALPSLSRMSIAATPATGTTDSPCGC